MVYLLDASALARICYHAQELSLLTARELVDTDEVISVKKSLDEAFREMFNEEKHGPH